MRSSPGRTTSSVDTRCTWFPLSPVARGADNGRPGYKVMQAKSAVRIVRICSVNLDSTAICSELGRWAGTG